MTSTALSPSGSLLDTLNTRYHRVLLNAFMVVTLLHWVEHLAQAYQIWVLGWARPKAGGALGLAFPSLVKSELLHYGYAIVMLVFLAVLLPGFKGRARTWWAIALGIQFWHHIEHLLLLIQAQTGHNFFGAAVPTSIAQLAFPRVELHLFYNSIVFLPMLVAVYLHLRPNRQELDLMSCSCARPAPVAAAA